MILTTSSQILFWSDSTLFERRDIAGNFGLWHKCEEFIDFWVGTNFIWFEKLRNSVYVLEDLFLRDYIEGVRVEDVEVKVEFTYDQMVDAFPLPFYSCWSLSQMISLQTSLILT